MRVLVIEDDQAVRETLGIVLEFENFSVDLTADSEGAFSELSQNWPDVVLLDLTLGAMSGEEIYEGILSRFGVAPPVIVLSAVQNPQTRFKSHLGGADILFLSKPYSIDALLEAIRSITQSQQSAA